MPLISCENLSDDSRFNYTDPSYARKVREKVGITPEFLTCSSRVEGPMINKIVYEPRHSELPKWKLALLRKSTPREDWDILAPFQSAKIQENDAVESSSGLAAVLLQIKSSAFEPEEDQFGPVRPTYLAFKTCMKLVLELAGSGKLIQPSDISVDLILCIYESRG